MEIGTTSYLLGRHQLQHNESSSLNQTLPKRHHHQVRQDPQQQQQHRRRRSTVTKLKDVPIPEISPIPSPRRRGTEEGQEEEQWVVARTEDGTDSQRKVRGSRSPLDRGTMSPPTSPTAKARQGSRASLASPVEQREAVARSRRTSSNLEGVRGMGGGGSSSSSSNVSEAIARHRAEQHQLVGWKRTSISEFRAIEAKELGGRSTSTPQSGASASSSSPGAITSMGKPASRSSSFTIAERKKSFESMARSGVVTSGSNSSSAAAAVPPKKTCLGNPPGPQRRPHHSSQDSLSVVAPRRTSRESLFETGGVGVFSSVSSLASTTASRRSSRDTICEEAETRMAVSPPHPPHPPPAAAAYGGGGGGSRRSSRSEADGGSRVTTPTKSAAAAAAAAPVTSTPSAPVDRSSSVTPTERRGGGAVVSRNSSRASERSARIHADTEEDPPLLPPKKRSSAADYYSRSTSAVSKDSGFTEDAPKKPAPSAEDRWSALERKYSTGTPADRTKEGKMDVVVVSGSSLVSPTSAMSIRELSEKFRAPTESSCSELAVLPTTTAVATSATSSRRDSTSSSSVQSGAAGEVEELCSASFRLGERANNFSWLEESAVGPPKQPFFYLPEESTEWESFDPADATTTTHAQSVGSRMMMTVAAAAMPMPVTSSPAPNSRATMAAKGRKFSAPVYSSSGRTAAARGEEGGIRMREKDDCSKIPSRPSSLVEGADGSERAKAFEVGNLGATASVAATAGSDLLSSSNSRGSSQGDLLSDAGCSSHNSGDALILLPGCGGGRSGSSVASGSATPHKSPALYRSTAATTGPSPSSFRSGGGGGGGAGGSESAGAAAAGGGGKDERRCVSVNDIRRAFEKAEQSLSQSMAASASECGSNGSPSLTPQSKAAGGKAGSSSSSSGGGGGFPSAPSHHRMSSMDSTASDESSIPAGTPHYYGSVSSLLSGHAGGGGGLKDHYGSISSLASSTSLISPNVSAFFLFFFCFRLKT